MAAARAQYHACLEKKGLVLEPCINITLVKLGLHFVFIMKKIMLLESVHFKNTMFLTKKRFA